MKSVIIIGAGPAGLKAACRIATEGYSVLLLEKEDTVGGKLKRWDKLFPDFASAQETLTFLEKNIHHQHITLKKNTEIVALRQEGNHWIVTDKENVEYQGAAILAATGYDFFDAKRKEEYGYGIYPNVITSVELEEMLAQKHIHYPSIAQNSIPRIAFIQ